MLFTPGRSICQATHWETSQPRCVSSWSGSSPTICSLDFIVNGITSPDGEVYQCVAGHPVAAHRSGAAYARQAFGVKVSQRYPVVVAACYPYEQDLWQSMKGLWCGELITADEGRLILLTQGNERLGGYSDLPVILACDPEDIKPISCLWRAAHPKEAATGIMVGRMKQRIRIALVSSGLTPDDASQDGYGLLRHRGGRNRYRR